jgi:hypothetical protein
MAGIRNTPLRVLEFSVEECPKAPTSGPPLFTFAQFHALRNEILSILFRYGTAGPNGKLRINESVDLSTEVWAHDGNDKPDFYVVSDIWNRWSRWIRVEADPMRVKAPLLEEIALTLSTVVRRLRDAGQDLSTMQPGHERIALR